MGLYSSFYASLSGLSSNASNLSVIGNNLANLNTIGFKGSASTFQDLFNASVGAIGTQGNGNPIQVGLGSRLGSINQNFGQGSFQSTSNVTDMAISGLGFFVLQLAGAQGAAYSRAGSFSLDRDGYLVDPNGNQVQGWNRQGNALSTNGPLQSIQINMGTTSPPVATQSFSSTTNLNADALNGTVYSTPVQVVDSLGATHSMLFTYTKRAPTGAETTAGVASAWDLAVTTDGGAAVAGYPPSVTFNSSGLLVSPAANPTLTITGWTNGATSPNTTWQIYNGNPPVSSLTGFASPSSTSNVTQDGYPAGTIRSLSVDTNGILSGNFTNGQTVALAQVAMATFANINGLRKMGDNTWSDTLASGPANTGAANQGGRGTVLGANLELSNVDVAEEFTKLIIAQRGYQANGRVVTTSDELLQETLNLKR